MADETKAFSKLLSEAPLSANDDTVSLVGALGRSTQAGKFVLALGPGNSVTLDVDAVKGHHVLGGGVGQLIVQVDIARDKVPDSVTQQGTQAAMAPFALATPHHASHAGFNPYNSPVILDNLHTPAYLDHTTIYAHDHFTNPIVDSGATGHFPYFD
jgi:hypothetical protein